MNIWGVFSCFVCFYVCFIVVRAEYFCSGYRSVVCWFAGTSCGVVCSMAWLCVDSVGVSCVWGVVFCVIGVEM